VDAVVLVVAILVWHVIIHGRPEDSVPQQVEPPVALVQMRRLTAHETAPNGRRFARRKAWPPARKPGTSRAAYRLCSGSQTRAARSWIQPLLPSA
jgi:hypothetical protein